MAGLVQTDRGFVLHPIAPRLLYPVEVDILSLSTSQAVLSAIANNIWLTCSYNAKILFNTACKLRREESTAKLWGSLILLSSQGRDA